MLLALDARNRSVTVGLRDGGDWLTIRRLGSDRERTADEYALLLQAVREAAPASGKAIDSAWISSVVPALTPRLVEAVASAFGLQASVIGPGVRTGVKIRTDLPSEVGSDLVCVAAAARELVKGACVVVDFGAAIAFSAINAAGEFLGAAIAPGIETAQAALRSTAAQIPDVRLEPPRFAIGRNTAASIQSGILLGYSGLVSRLVGLMREELGAAHGGSGGSSSVDVIGTGDALGRG
ncbi:MAG TPA: type III pantothenate kinase, partial [Rectinemataceae bacterium]|nr:type III pantothenate kinase [Rectinemataceae bacterium]